MKLFNIIIITGLISASSFVSKYNKAYEKKSATSIQEKTSTEYIDKLTDCMHQIRSVNKRDVVNLASVFGSLSEIMQATKEELLMCPGIGATKAKRIYDAFHVPFVVDKTKKST